LLPTSYSLFEVAALNPQFVLRDMPGFPYSEYSENLARYEDLERWFSGEALEDSEEQNGKQVDLYPLRINPLKSTLIKHAYTLLGEAQDDTRPVVYPKFSPVPKELRASARAAEQLLHDWWYENNARALLLDQALMCQVYGGCVFRLAYVPWESWRKVPVRLDAINPKSFVGIPTGRDFWNLREAWLAYEIGPQTARDYGVTLASDQTATLTEHYTRTRIEISINGAPVSFRVGDQSYSIQDNPFGVVPLVYIPALRTGKFYGYGLIGNLTGLVKEINLRTADRGDAAADDTHSYLYMRNVNGTPRVFQLAPGLRVVDLGSGGTNIVGNEAQPEIGEVRKPVTSQALSQLTADLYEQYRRDAFMPAVAEGEDEGSQRSALTLAMRMWPLTSYINLQRMNWTVGLNQINRYLMTMLAIKRPEAIPVAVRQLRLKQVWEPMMPRDREQLINEIVQRAGVNLGSPELLLEKAGDVEDIEEEIKRIERWLTFLNNLKVETAEAQATARAEAMGPGADAGAASSPAAQTKPKDE
jgi:hypothetical protein